MKSGTGSPVVAEALARIAMFRQAEVTASTLDLYSARLAEEALEVADIVEACGRIERAERTDGETAFPSLGMILRVCREVVMDRSRTGRTDEWQPSQAPAELSPERAKYWLARLRDAAKGRHGAN
jgi:hypothetical protein